ncbi:hypothetical protein G6F65_016639 [Rhizopus arrhizus]|nr:hypothetical protein G6F65_016639 [Rhizopus arrhizus]
MLVEDRGAPALEPQAAPRAASLLLHCLAVALLVCIAAGATLYLYWAFNDVVSSHRRHMNAAAYDAQQFFDQREALLRSLSASAVRNVGSEHLDDALAHTGAAPQVEVLPLQEADGAYDWALVLTRRDLHRVALARTKVVYSSPRQASTLRMAARDQVALAPIPADTQAWLSRTLANVTLRPSATGQTRIIWLHPPQDTDKRLFLFTPLDPVEPEAGWIGLEVQGVESAVDTPQAGAGNYVLFEVKLSTDAVLFAYIGGVNAFLGPVLGASILTFLSQTLADITRSWLLYQGVLARPSRCASAGWPTGCRAPRCR